MNVYFTHDPYPIKSSIFKAIPLVEDFANEPPPVVNRE